MTRAARFARRTLMLVCCAATVWPVSGRAGVSPVSARSATWLVPGHAVAQTLAPSAPPAEASDATCDLVSAAEISDILGFAVQEPDEISRRSGICFFATRGVSDDGSASYALVRPEDLPQRRALFRALGRQCPGPSTLASPPPTCVSYAKLAVAMDLDAYFAGRTEGGTTTPVPHLGTAAFVADDALYVRGNSRVIEAIVKRGDGFDLSRTTALAALVLARSQP